MSTRHALPLTAAMLFLSLGNGRADFLEPYTYEILPGGFAEITRFSNDVTGPVVIPTHLGGVSQLALQPLYGAPIGVEYAEEDLSASSWLDVGDFLPQDAAAAPWIFVYHDPARASRPAGCYRAFLRETRE